MIRFELPRKEHHEFLSKYFKHLPELEQFLVPVTKQGAPIYTFVSYFDEQNDERQVLAAVGRAFLTKKGMHISYIAVDEAVRRSGIAQEMVEVVQDMCRGTLLKTITLNTRETNRGMIHFVHKLGFTCFDLTHNYSDGTRKLEYKYEVDSGSE